jgi:lipopolysaccharide transport system permease protein
MSIQNSDAKIQSPHSIETPLIRIEPYKHSRVLGLKELWDNRELIFFLGQRDVKVRYKQTVLGVGWAIIQPLATAMTFWFFLGKLGHIPSDGVPYGLFIFTGVMLWNFFSNAVSNSGASIVNTSHLITKIYLPRLAIPIASVGTSFFDVGISSLVLALFLWSYKVTLSWSILLAPVILLMTGMVALAVGLLSSTYSAKYRDVRYALPFFLQLGMYASPVAYPLSQIPVRWRHFAMLNPMAGLIDSFRASILGKPIDWKYLAISFSMGFLLLIVGLVAFRRAENEFADNI